jgi:hypothetical protein
LLRSLSAFLCRLNGPTLVAVLAVAGMAYVGALLARPERELPTPGVAGAVVAVVSLTVVAIVALHVEGKNRNATYSEGCRDESTDS